ncbi:MAG: metal ABC transporter substrate-binding protein [Patescibacteria group bacterium]
MLNLFRPLVLIFCTIFIVGLFYLINLVREEQIDDQREISTNNPNSLIMPVTASIYPIGWLVDQIINDPLFPVGIIVPGGIEPHEYEPKPTDLQLINNSSLLFWSGGSIDGWVGEQTPKHGVSINLGETIASIYPKDDDGYGKTLEHYWLDPNQLIDLVPVIVRSLGQIDNVKITEYKKNGANLITSLLDLDTAYKTGLADCNQSTIVTSHDAYGHLGEAYGFSTKTLAGLSPEDEPGAQTLAQLSLLLSEQSEKYILFEPETDSGFAAALSKSTGATILPLHTLEFLTPLQQENHDDYLTLMRANLATLKIALVCE